MNNFTRIIHVIFLMIWLLPISGCNGVLASPDADSPRLSAQECQTTLEEFQVLKDIFNTKDRVNVNDYFSVLDHLSIESGYTLDYYYVLAENFMGWPKLYARPIEQTPLPNQSFEPYTEESKTPVDQGSWVQHIQIDDSKLGYFEFILLYTMGDQFKLFWHAENNDYTVICGPSALEKEIKEHNIDEQVPDFLENAKKFRFEPKVVFKENFIEIQVIGFESWGGLSKSTFTLSRSFPHTILERVDETLVECPCGVIY